MNPPRSTTRRQFVQSAAALGVSGLPLMPVGARAALSPAEYTRHDATGLAALVRKGEVSAQELAQCAHAAMSTVNPRINAVIGLIAVDAGALQQAASGPFQGVPFLLKDVAIGAQGVPREMGSRLLQGVFRSQHDSYLMTRFRKAGLVSLGRTNTPEFAFNVSTEPAAFGPTRNPWDLRLSAGGSSGGSAAAVAAGIVPMAHATDGGGSIRIPAAHNGLFGLKPTRGRVSPGPEVADPLFGMGVDFALSRSVRDSAALLDAVEGPAPGDPYTIARPQRPYAIEVHTAPRRLKVAFHVDAGQLGSTDPQVVSAVRKTANLLQSLGHHVEEAQPKYDEELFHAANLRLWTAFLASGVAALSPVVGRVPSPENLESSSWSSYLAGKRMTALELAEAQAWMNAICRQVAPFFSQYDVLLTPVMAAPPLPLGTLNANEAGLSAEAHYRRVFQHAPFTALYNMTGQPAMSLPLASSHEGLPIGMQIVGQYGDEATLFQLAGQLERALPWAQRRPPVHASHVMG
ncbi:amidase [Aquabacterium sp. A7-Y]|uniref:amidase n=1 Tax=Aquabacterium sp. A7-Y TaxID=1349605 RepID=UPI00223DD9D1|nr:amidase [Aquabacterium sp. A7-Y]MCW7538437.1 amidase [Aquabacterium sp. A7-Y]